MVPEMYKKNIEIGLSTADAVRMELATSLAMLSSGAITTFWLLFHIVSDPDVLAAVRKELLGLVINETATSTSLVKVVDISGIRTECPTLMAMFHETLRFHSTAINIKEVAHDTTLNTEYLLKKGSTVMISGTSVHLDNETWGPSAETFDHRRFFTPEGQRNLGVSTAFRPFGAGATKCPGRNFSINDNIPNAFQIRRKATWSRASPFWLPQNQSWKAFDGAIPTI